MVVTACCRGRANYRIRLVSRSSGDAALTSSAVQAVQNVGRIPEMQQLSRDTRRLLIACIGKRTLRFKPEDLSF